MAVDVTVDVAVDVAVDMRTAGMWQGGKKTRSKRGSAQLRCCSGPFFSLRSDTKLSPSLQYLKPVDL